MDLELVGKRVMVTGGSKGIGLAVAESFLAEGVAELHLVARNKEVLQAAQSSLESTKQKLKSNVDITIHALDLSQSSSIAELAKSAASIDILVNNAGAIPGGTLNDISDSAWREAWDLKVFGYINMTREFFNAMSAKGQGVIVNVIGMAGERPDFSYIAGTAGNASLMAFTKGVGSRSIDHGVRVLAVNPGLTETDRVKTLMTKKAAAELGDADRWREFFQSIPLARPATTAEVADVVVFLASARANYMSGVVVPVDGGWGVRNS